MQFGIGLFRCGGFEIIGVKRNQKCEREQHSSGSTQHGILLSIADIARVAVQRRNNNAAAAPPARSSRVRVTAAALCSFPNHADYRRVKYLI